MRAYSDTVAPVRNWAGNITFSAATIAYPETIEQLQAIVQAAQKVRVLGFGHSFNRIADTPDTLVSLRNLQRRIEIDSDARTVTIDGGASYADIAPALHAAGFALANVASLPNITIAGAVVTATHGSGDSNRNLAAAVRGLRLVTASGDIVSLSRGDADFAGAVVSLGALGVIAEMTLDLVPTFDIRQTVYLNLPVATVIDNIHTLTARAYSVSHFTRWQGDSVDQVWVKALAEDGEPAADILGALPATAASHPIPGMDGSTCTGQFGVAGPWHERLFHFSIGNAASAGAELQSELFVARADAPAAIAALHAVQDQFSPALFVSEIRSVAADDLWLSSACRQDTIGFHFTWKPDWDTTIAAVGVAERALAPFAPRPHWAKLFTLAPDVVRSRYPRMPEFKALADRMDPEGKFRNDFVTDLLFA
ncbi:xylitol oxidase [Devosia lucknowensis]|uniref:Xylitol oxidase n=1 Tax=Devosia lucknowensis TaxID=1096929 RepID=A0A1Y6ETV2_9HYPH|nr:FAD-binding protein [Devosia lucknowensis]SMQ65977.1 xylitol oxidase [Devosia lucknowensis]